jgi:hypothetical protein
MARISIHLPDAIERKVRKAAKANGQSRSRWIAGQIAERLDDTWPAGVLNAAGSFPEFPDVEEIRRPAPHGNATLVDWTK